MGKIEEKRKKEQERERRERRGEEKISWQKGCGGNCG